jgi:hypothetical protein
LTKLKNVLYVLPTSKVEHTIKTDHCKSGGLPTELSDTTVAWLRTVFLADGRGKQTLNNNLRAMPLFLMSSGLFITHLGGT